MLGRTVTHSFRFRPTFPGVFLAVVAWSLFVLLILVTLGLLVQYVTHHTWDLFLAVRTTFGAERAELQSATAALQNWSQTDWLRARAAFLAAVTLVSGTWFWFRSGHDLRSGRFRRAAPDDVFGLRLLYVCAVSLVLFCATHFASLGLLLSAGVID